MHLNGYSVLYAEIFKHHLDLERWLKMGDFESGYKMAEEMIAIKQTLENHSEHIKAIISKLAEMEKKDGTNADSTTARR